MKRRGTIHLRAALLFAADAQTATSASQEHFFAHGGRPNTVAIVNFGHKHVYGMRRIKLLNREPERLDASPIDPGEVYRSAVLACAWFV